MAKHSNKVVTIDGIKFKLIGVKGGGLGDLYGYILQALDEPMPDIIKVKK